MIHKLFMTGLLGCIGFWSASAQPRVLGVEELFHLADAHSKSLKVHNLAVDEAVQAIKVAKNDRLPSIEAGLSFSYIGDGWMSDRDFSNGMKADMPHFGNNFAFKATQAVYTGGAVSTGIEMSELQKEMAETELDNDRQNVRFMLVGHYLDLFQLHNQRRVYEKNIEQTRLLIEEIRSAFEQGAALQSDITRYELQLKNLELGLTNVNNRIRILNRQMVTTIGLDIQTEILPDTTLLSAGIDKQSELHWQDARSQAPVMRMADLGVRMSEKQQEMARAGRRPTIGLIAANNFDGPILIEVPPINKNFNYWYVGVNVTYKFDALFKNNKKVKQAKLATLKAQENKRLADEQLSNGINAAYINLEEAYTRLDTKEKNVQLAHENYEVIHSRYLNGLSLVTDMLDASNVQLSSELELANAQIGILYQYFMLKKTIGTL
ncbi:TolC family protein [Phocaeicola sp.]|uniref:TolC family protein n=1 Tax=Phocaeicola sp. TaxID=2773926 RepID=UPI002840D708|nr:TolC family protein [Phocaeicola sp.]MDR3795740.1 TolC family protein [Phocaeicola sp.]